MTTELFRILAGIFQGDSPSVTLSAPIDMDAKEIKNGV